MFYGDIYLNFPLFSSSWLLPCMGFLFNLSLWRGHSYWMSLLILLNIYIYIYICSLKLFIYIFIYLFTHIHKFIKMYSFNCIKVFLIRNIIINYILITNLMKKWLFIRIILYSSTCFEPYIFISRRSHCIHAAYVNVTLYEVSWWPVGAQIKFSLSLCTDRPPRPHIQSDSTICCMYTMWLP
jgi:hypothetical protein